MAPMRKLTRMAVGVAVSALVLASCGSAGDAPEQPSDDAEVQEDAGAENDGPAVLSVATQTPPQSMDPVDASGGSIPYMQAVYDTLIHREADGTLTPWLATDWELDDEGTALTLTLRDDVTFDDGTALDAEAVKANLDRFKEEGGPEAPRADTTESVEVVDETTVVIHLESPDPALTDALSDAYGFIANPAKFDEEDPFAVVPGGTGPYTLNEEESVTGSSWVFDRRDDWWGEELPFETITYLVLNDENAIINGLLTGQIDAATIQGPIDQIEGQDGFTIEPQEIDLKIFNIFDREGEQVEAFGDQRVRQAINHALDKETYLDAIQDGRGTVTSQMWSPDAPGFVEALDSYYEYDPEKAQELMDEAGFDNVEFTLARLPGLVNDALAEAMRSDLAKIGIELTWEDVDQGSFLQRTFYEQEFPGVVMNGGQSALDWSTYLGVVAPSPASNPKIVMDDEINELAAVVAGGSEEDAAAAAQQMNERLVELAWFAPLFRMEYAHVAVDGVTATPQVGLAVPSIYNYGR